LRRLEPIFSYGDKKKSDYNYNQDQVGKERVHFPGRRSFDIGDLQLFDLCQISDYTECTIAKWTTVPDTHIKRKVFMIVSECAFAEISADFLNHCLIPFSVRER
jgi:hypothetical protein